MTSLQIHISVWFNTINTIAGVRGGGGYSRNVYMGRVRPEVQPLTLLYAIFHKKGTPFVHFLLTNGTPLTHLI